MPPPPVIELWRELVELHGNARIVHNDASSIPWKKIVLHLLAIADEACSGIGFSPSGTAISEIFYKDHMNWVRKRMADPRAIGGRALPYLPNSLCSRVPPEILCVQPKTSTPVVGCTVRSLTHHLALLPPIGNVTTHWYVSDKKDGGAFNMLVVPFPYSIPGKSFIPQKGKFPGAGNDRAFTLNPATWMAGVDAKKFAEFLLGLIEAAKPELELVHAIVLPETALRLELADEVATILARETRLEMFLAGVVGHVDGDTRNAAAIYRFDGGEVIQSSFQSKHHRWCLNGDQIRRYQLGHILDPRAKWWEQIDVSHRDCYVTLFRPQATLSVLICEDLARYDPVLTVMNAIGPNLVVALLMDGPQLEHRWPGRYATALADDPGSAVLTVTSLGMVLRSAMPGDPENREIALWKEPEGRARALKLPKGHHALLLTLTSRGIEQVTLDGRGDRGATINFTLGAARGIKHPTPPAWVGAVS